MCLGELSPAGPAKAMWSHEDLLPAGRRPSARRRGAPSRSKPSTLSCSMTHTDVERARRRDENENLFREGADVDNLDLHCECGENSCAERLAVSVSDYLRVRKWDGRFLLVPEHQDEELENVVERHKSCLVVQRDKR